MLWRYASGMSRLPTRRGPIGRQRLGALALAATGALFIWRSLAELPLGTIDNPGPAAMPLLLAVLLMLFALWSLIGGASDLLIAAEAHDSGEPSGARHAVRIVAATIVAALALGPLGYRLMILGLLAFFLGLVERKPIITVLVVSFASRSGATRCSNTS